MSDKSVTTKTVSPGARSGGLTAPSSKSQAHRLMICSALSGDRVVLSCRGLSDDITATARCLSGLGAESGVKIREVSSISINPIFREAIKERRYGGRLECRESGSTLRFMLPVVGALGADAELYMEGRLPLRPLSPLLEQLCRHGMSIERRGESGQILSCSGRLEAGAYELPGNVSSQYISGLLMALPLLDGDSRLDITSERESTGYIDMTEDVMRRGGARFDKDPNGYTVYGGQRYSYPKAMTVEGDWSSAAFFLCMGAFSDSGVTVTGLDIHSAQGDRRITDILKGFGADVEISGGSVTVKRGKLRGRELDARMIPDIIPVLSVVAAGAEGETRVINARRLRLKESDRIHSVVSMINSLGGKAEETEDGLTVHGTGGLSGGTVDSFSDHRIAMSAAAAACFCSGPVTVTDPGCTEKSYPGFWDEFDRLEERS